MVARWKTVHDGKFGKSGLVNRDDRLTQDPCICPAALVQGFVCGLHWPVSGRRWCCFEGWQQGDSTRTKRVGDVHPWGPLWLTWTWHRATCYSGDIGSVGSWVGPETCSLSLAVMLWPKNDTIIYATTQSFPHPSISGWVNQGHSSGLTKDELGIPIFCADFWGSSERCRKFCYSVGIFPFFLKTDIANLSFAFLQISCKLLTVSTLRCMAKPDSFLPMKTLLSEPLIFSLWYPVHQQMDGCKLWPFCNSCSSFSLSLPSPHFPFPSLQKLDPKGRLIIVVLTSQPPT